MTFRGYILRNIICYIHTYSCNLLRERSVYIYLKENPCVFGQKREQYYNCHDQLHSLHHQLALYNNKGSFFPIHIYIYLYITERAALVAVLVVSVCAVTLITFIYTHTHSGEEKKSPSSRCVPADRLGLFPATRWKRGREKIKEKYI